ncbi:MAG: LysR family transcriptional regulator [Gammaproteobacteria bacterium]|nr:LysR family transcriptional regulator [Gammaproteobacteria bacterium]
MKRPRLNILRTFAAAGRCLSFSEAAADLKISQAAVSQQMRQLEAYLNSPLFVRHHRRLSLTSTGLAYFEAVHEALDRLDTITDQLFPAQHHQSVTLHCTAGVAALWLIPQLKSFQRSHRNIDLRLKTLDHADDHRKLSTSELEIYLPGKSPIERNAVKLLTSTITPVCSPALFVQAARPQQPDDLHKFGLIHVLGYDDDWHRWFNKHLQTDVDVSQGLLVDGSLIAIEAALRGDGVMLGRRPFIDHHLQSGELVEVFAKPCHLYTDYYLKQPPKTTIQRECSVVVKWLTDLAAQSITSHSENNENSV